MILAYRRLAAASPDAPTLVWLHGFLGSHREWLAQAQALPQYAHVLIDLPGHGDSAALTVDDFARCDAALRDTLRAAGVTSYGLIGYSLGGRLAMYHGCQGASGLWALAVEGETPDWRRPRSARRGRHMTAAGPTACAASRWRRCWMIGIDSRCLPIWMSRRGPTWCRCAPASPVRRWRRCCRRPRWVSSHRWARRWRH
ncbi:alpha/beta fold hydrolase [Edwardsiella ictaluri]|uniref:alpha/beta fold hydrolase n=1 Tax=Edwardsiella ictaluri TaxID=67780 RepID=UPI0039F684B6